MTVPVNPQTFTITDPSITADNVTGFRVLFSQTSGGPYTIPVTVPPADIDAAAGTVTGKVSDLNAQLSPGPWFAVAEAVNAAGDSPNSPEAELIVLPLPKAPTAFIFA
jgi:hypothetical protein